MFGFGKKPDPPAPDPNVSHAFTFHIFYNKAAEEYRGVLVSHADRETKCLPARTIGGVFDMAKAAAREKIKKIDAIQEPEPSRIITLNGHGR